MCMVPNRGVHCIHCSLRGFHDEVVDRECRGGYLIINLSSVIYTFLIIFNLCIDIIIILSSKFYVLSFIKVQCK